MITRIVIVTATVFCTLMATGCNPDETPDERIVSAYVDVMIVRQSSTDTTVISQRVDSVLQHHGFTSDAFFERVRKEGQRPRMFKAMFDSVAARYERMSDTTSR
jgi:hypothetical protein